MSSCEDVNSSGQGYLIAPVQIQSVPTSVRPKKTVFLPFYVALQFKNWTGFIFYR